MIFQAPAGIDDLAAFPQLKQAFVDLWNDDQKNFVASYVKSAASRSRNYVDPSVTPPTGDPVKFPWNGFPKALSRWYDDEHLSGARERAEQTADVPTPILSWVQPSGGDLRLFETEAHRLPFFVERLGAHVTNLAGPWRYFEANGSLGPVVPRVRRQQDEYLEWHAKRDAGGRLQALVFTAEPPDYWTALALVAPKVVLDLYQRLVDPSITSDDLFFIKDVVVRGIDQSGQEQWFTVANKGDYNPLNVWTTTKGIMHLTHAANTLGAEVNLAADASNVWASDKAPPPAGPNAPAPETRRVACGNYGGINRSSDPLIGKGVGDAVGSGARVTLTDPIGLYVANADLASLAGPAGQPIPDALKIVRGNDDPFEPRILRFEVSLKAGTLFGLEDCKFDGRPLRSGGQIARKTTMHLYANAYPGNHDDTALKCNGRPCRHPQRTETFSIGPPDAADPCPDPAETIWLFETPFEGGGPLPMAAEVAHAAGPQVVVPSAAVPASLSKSRNPAKA